MEAFDVIRTRKLDREAAVALIHGCFADLAMDVQGRLTPDLPDRGEFLLRQRVTSEEFSTSVAAQLDAGEFGAAIRRVAEDRLRRLGVNLRELDENSQGDVLDGVARALIEQQRLFRFRLNDRFTPYPAADPLFAGEINFTARCVPQACAEPKSRPDYPVGPTVGQLVERYLKAKKLIWARKTHENYTSQLAMLVEALGPNRPASAVRPRDLAEYRDALKRLRLRHHVGAGKSFTARQTDNLDQRIDPKTAALRFDTAKTLFRWAKLDGYLAENPAAEIPNEVPKNPKAKKSRRPFSSEELTRIFTAPVYTGCKGVKRRFVAGDMMLRDAYFWVPLIGHFTGARLGEIVQLHLADVHLDGPVPYIEISFANDGTVDASEDKHLKSAAAIRKVPIHPDLMELGLRAFVAQRSKLGAKRGRLFHEIRYGGDGVPSAVFSKWFGRFLGKLGLHDPSLVFHSFRHSAEDAFRNAGQPQYVIDRIIGHMDDATSAGYGEGISLETAYGAVKAMKLKVNLPEVMAPPVSAR